MLHSTTNPFSKGGANSGQQNMEPPSSHTAQLALPSILFRHFLLICKRIRKLEKETTSAFFNLRFVLFVLKVLISEKFNFEMNL